MEATLQAEKRTDRGKNEARRHRAAGRLPAVVYGRSSSGEGSEAIPVTVDPKLLTRILHSESGTNTIITLDLEGQKAPVLVKEYLLNPVTHALLHVDFYRVSMDRAITVAVPVVLKGEPRGVKQQGGMLDFVTRQFEIECLPGEIPEHIEIDVTELMINQGIRIRDVAEGVRWTPVSEPETMLVHVVAPRIEEAPAAEAAAPTAEPEIIKKGKPEETKS